jgi:tetratricopeptide (TPR) repeat protein
MLSITITIADLFEFEGKLPPVERPDDAAIGVMVQRQFRFLPQPINVQIEPKAVTISYNEESPTAKAEAARLASRASKRAAEGSYSNAISAWKRALELQPTLRGARLDLAMVLVEKGDTDGAKNQLIEVLRLNPKDHWACVVLGNLYVQSENDLATGERFLRRALDIAPNDARALNGLAAIAAKRGQMDEAVRLFEQSSAANPELPNPHHGLALTYQRIGQLERAEAALDVFFTKTKAQDARSMPVFANARALYAEVEEALAQKQHSDAFKAVENLRGEVERLSGYPVRVTEGEFQDKTGAIIQMAWKRGWDHHLIRCRKSYPPHLLTHLMAHELTHLRLESEARKIGKNRFFTTTTATEQAAKDRIQGDIRRIQRLGYPDDSVHNLVKSLITGLANFLYNCPLDMLIEAELRVKMPVLHAAQFESLLLMAVEAWEATNHPDIRQVTPPLIFRASLAMNGAFALFLDHLFKGATDVASRYQKLEAFGLSQRLFQHWQSRQPHLGPGDEYALVDEFADMLGMRGWFAWQPDSGHHEVMTAPQQEGATNADLLKKKYPAAVWHLLAVLKRYDKLPVEKVREIAFEAASVGRNGLDYASPEPKYTLKSLPDEQFTGLQMMCLMYAGFKRIAPEHDLGMDLNDPFLTALELFQTGESGA